MDHGKIASTCGVCFSGCGILVDRRNGLPTAIGGDKTCPTNRGFLCRKGRNALAWMNHPGRLTHPLLNTGEKGGGNWRRISWGEALDRIAERFTSFKDRYGAESVAFAHGSAKGFQDNYLKRLASAFGTPNVATQSHVCYVPSIRAHAITCGFPLFADLEGPLGCLVTWGENIVETRTYDVGLLRAARAKGTKLIVIDPRKTSLAKTADLWLPVRPGSDLALALGLLHVIIREHLFDAAFLQRWCVGFDDLSRHVRAYDEDTVSRLTGVDPDLIAAAARMYAGSSPAAISTGNGIETNATGFQTSRAVSLLMAVTGNLAVPGGNVPLSTPPIFTRHAPELTLHDLLLPDIWGKRVGSESPLLPAFTYVTPQAIVRAILQEEPYPIHGLFIQACNPLLTYPNARETYRALRKVGFLVVSELFMTPTALLADIVLPSASFLEYDNVVLATYALQVRAQRKVMELAECRSDYRIIHELAGRLGLGSYFGPNEEAFLDLILKPSGLSFRDFLESGEGIPRKRLLRAHEKTGFRTPSGRVELFSQRLKDWGFDPLPVYREPPETPFSSPKPTTEYPIILFSWKDSSVVHSSGRHLIPQRSGKVAAIALLHPDTAAGLRIRPGEAVSIETAQGRIVQEARISSEVPPGTIGVDYGCWFPEQGADGEFGWAEANVNILTDSGPPFGREMGATNLRGICCRVSPLPENASNSRSRSPSAPATGEPSRACPSNPRPGPRRRKGETVIERN